MNPLIALFIVTDRGIAGTSSNGEKRDCTKDPPYLPKTIVNTSIQLDKLRDGMRERNLSAYMIPSTDAHGSEYVRERDKRRQFISGFSGSAGFAIVTLNEAALWTDGRYFLQADTQLDCNWILQKQGVKGVPSRTEWLKQVLRNGDVVGIDPFLINTRLWDKYAKALKEGNITLKGVNGNLVDMVWPTQPAEELKQVFVQPYNFTGKTWWDKVLDVQKKMKENKVAALVVQALDAVAWLLNLRGEEVPYNPVFFAYAVVKDGEVLFFINSSKISLPEVKKHLQLSSCAGKSHCITVKPYDTIQEELKKLSKNAREKIWLTPLDSHALRLDIPDERVFLDYSPITLMKAKKNEVELQGFRSANIAKKIKITELSLADKMEEFRSQQALYRGLSFASILGFGSNGAVIHYIPSDATNKEVTDQSTLLADTGSQYSDGTTDITRTVHFGTPTAEQRSAYTRVLIGQIDLATAVFPTGTYGRELDIFAREALYKNGWDYRHGTGHGIGSYLFIHEGPGTTFFGKVNNGFPNPRESPLYIGFVTSDEPGFYKDGDFGIRLETVFTVVNATTPNRFNGIDYLTLKPISFIKWVNDYHKKTRALVGDELKRQKKNDEYDWLIRATEPIETGMSSTASPRLVACFSLFVVVVILL